MRLLANLHSFFCFFVLCHDASGCDCDIPYWVPALLFLVFIKRCICQIVRSINTNIASVQLNLDLKQTTRFSEKKNHYFSFQVKLNQKSICTNWKFYLFLLKSVGFETVRLFVRSLWNLAQSQHGQWNRKFYFNDITNSKKRLYEMSFISHSCDF